MKDYRIDVPKDWRQWARPAALIALGLFVLYGVFTAYYTVAPDGKAVVKRLGRVVGVKDPGLHFKLPFGIETAEFVPTDRVLKQEFGFRTVVPGQRTQYMKNDAMRHESLMLTGDLNVIDVEWVVQYRIIDPVKYLFRVRDQTEAVRDVAEAVMRQVVGNQLGSEVLTIGRVTIAASVQETMQKILDSYESGLRVTGLELQDVTPPDPVKNAFNEVNEARQQKERLINLAEKERNQLLPKARGEAQQTVAEAEGYALEQVNQAKGETSRFTALLEEYRTAEEITRRRLLLETIDEVDLGGLYVLDKSTASPLPLFDLGGAPAKSLKKTLQKTGAGK